MIEREEVLNVAREFSLRPEVVEKDYVLGWILAAIGQHASTRETWVFKGGTCLKKCYFETYRFSEDLDFTLLDSSHLTEDFLKKLFTEIPDWVYEACGLEISKDDIVIEIYQNPRGNPSVQSRLGYRGPLRRSGSLPRVRFDLTHDERVVLTPVRRRIHHPYSDAPDEDMEVACYPFEELFAEKIRALKERLRPRDLYDVIHLFRHSELTLDRELTLKILTEKCTFKNLPLPAYGDLNGAPEKAELQAEWSNMLSHQLPALPLFEQFWAELSNFFEWLTGRLIPAKPERVAVGADEDVAWVPPSVAQPWGFRVPLEVIRFAGANRLCVKLGYHGSTRLIEPYALRRTKDGNLLLHAIKVDTRESRSYRVDRIESAEITAQTFKPVYEIELTPVGPISAPPQTRIPKSFYKPPPSRRRRATSVSSFGSKYTFQCTACGKRFTRSSYDASLKPHKNKQGYQCFGAFGNYVGMKYR